MVVAAAAAVTLAALVGIIRIVVLLIIMVIIIMVRLGTCVFRRRERYVNLFLGIVRAYAASTVGNTGRCGDFGSWEVEG